MVKGVSSTSMLGSKMRWLLLLCFVTPACTGWQTARHSDVLTPDESERIGTEAAACLPAPNEPTACRCTFSSRGSEFVVESSGKAHQIGTDGGGKSFDLPLAGGSLVRLFSAAYGGDVIVVFEATNNEDGWGGVARINQGSATPVWALNIPGFNVSEGAIEGRFLYQAALGFVAKVDLDSGQYMWSRSDLYDRERGSFNVFRRPAVGAVEVEFQEQVLPYAKNKVPRTIRVNKHDGRLTID
jgi:hypothetical protein